MCNQLHPKNFAGAGTNVFNRFGYLDPAALATSAGVNLRFNDPDWASAAWTASSTVWQAMLRGTWTP
jgi:hypothetical protein